MQVFDEFFGTLSQKEYIKRYFIQVDECHDDFIKGLTLSIHSLIQVETLVEESEKKRYACFIFSLHLLTTDTISLSNLNFYIATSTKRSLIPIMSIEDRLLIKLGLLICHKARAMSFYDWCTSPCHELIELLQNVTQL